MGNTSGRETVKHHHHNKHDHKRRHHAFRTRRHRHTHYGGVGSKLNPSYTAEPSSKTRKRRRETEAKGGKASPEFIAKLKRETFPERYK